MTPRKDGQPPLYTRIRWTSDGNAGLRAEKAPWSFEIKSFGLGYQMKVTHADELNRTEVRYWSGPPFWWAPPASIESCKRKARTIVQKGKV